MGTLAEYGMLMTAMALVLALLIPSAIEPFQARMAEVRGAALLASQYRLVASLEDTSSWVTQGWPKWFNSTEMLAHSHYSVVGTRQNGVKFAFSPKAKASDTTLAVPSLTCANFYISAPDTVSPRWWTAARVFSIPCESGQYQVVTYGANICPANNSCTVIVDCAQEGVCDIQWIKEVNGFVVREIVQYVVPQLP